MCAARSSVVAAGVKLSPSASPAELGMSGTSSTSSPSTEALAGLVERVTFHNAETGFCVLRAKVRG